MSRSVVVMLLLSMLTQAFAIAGTTTDKNRSTSSNESDSADEYFFDGDDSTSDADLDLTGFGGPTDPAPHFFNNDGTASDGGVLTALFAWLTPTWEEAFLDELDALDLLSLIAASDRARNRFDLNLDIHIRNPKDLHRLLAIPVRSHAFLQVRSLHFHEWLYRSQNDTDIAFFIRSNLQVLTNLKRLTIVSNLSHPSSHVMLSLTADNGYWAAPALRTNDDFIVPIVLLQPLTRIQKSNNFYLPDILTLRLLFDRQHANQLVSLEKMAPQFSPRELIFQGLGFVTERVQEFHDLLRFGRFSRLESLQIINTQLAMGNGFQALAQMLAEGCLQNLTQFIFDHHSDEVEKPLRIELECIYDSHPENAPLPRLKYFSWKIGMGLRVQEEAFDTVIQLVRNGVFLPIRTLTIHHRLTDTNIEQLLELAPQLAQLESITLTGVENLSLTTLERFRSVLPPACKILFN